jgi:hypothetical protein
MHGQGTFFDARLDNADQFPIAAKAGFGYKQSDPDLSTAKLSALHFYQLAIPTPTPPEGSFDPEAAMRGAALFTGKANCAPLYTEPGWNTHQAAEIGTYDFQANRSPDQSYRTAPLRSLWAHQKGASITMAALLPCTRLSSITMADAHFSLAHELDSRGYPANSAKGAFMHREVINAICTDGLRWRVTRSVPQPLPKLLQYLMIERKRQ